MCVIFFYANSQPGTNGYKLILASNRDEFFARNTQTAAKWSNADHVYGGASTRPTFANIPYVLSIYYHKKELIWSQDVKAALG